jgi:hypothetical protein
MMSNSLEEIYRSPEYQQLSAQRKAEINGYTPENRLRALKALKPLSQSDLGEVAFNQLPDDEKARIMSLPPIARINYVRSLGKISG